VPATKKLNDLVALPPKKDINKGITSAREKTRLNKLGIPGQKTKKCSQPTGEFTKRVVRKTDVGPFKVDGLDVAVASLKLSFSKLSKGCLTCTPR
jgi:hypothetical protein